MANSRIDQIGTQHTGAVDDTMRLEMQAADLSGRWARPSVLLNQPGAAITAASAALGGAISGANYFILSQATGDAGTVGFSNANGPGIVFWGSAAAGGGKLQFNTGGAERMYITSLGAVVTSGDLVSGGVINPGNLGNWYLHTSSGNPIINFDSNDALQYDRTGNLANWYFGGVRAIVAEAGGFYSGIDNSLILGHPSARWSVIYAATGTINTSDPAEKRDLRPFDDDELAAAREFKFVAYRWKDAVGKKGAKARIHFGFDAQQVLDTLLKHKIDPDKFAGFCRDPIVRRVKKTRQIERVKRETVEIEEPREEIDGERVVRRVYKKTIERDVTRALPLVDDKGAPIMEFGAIVTGTDGKPLLDRAGQPTRRMVAATRQVPVMEAVEEEYEADEDTVETRMSLRHDYLFALKIAALEAAK